MNTDLFPEYSIYKLRLWEEFFLKWNFNTQHRISFEEEIITKNNK